MSNSNVITIYVDGSSLGNPGPSGIGVVFQWNDIEREFSKDIGKTTNSVAELTAIKMALEQLKTTDLPVRIYTDSRYCHGILMFNWKAKMNTELVDDIRTSMKRFRDVQIVKIAGHKGVPGNERADKLARAASKTWA